MFEPGAAPSALTVTNSTFTGNRADGKNGFGGAIMFEPASGSTGTLTQVTIAGNSTTGTNEAGGILVEDAPVTIRNSIISGNTAAGAVDNCTATSGGQLSKAGHNIELGTSCGFDINADPKLAALADNGGPTKTMALPAGSPAIDAADPAYCPPTDQRGVARPDGGTGGSGSCDLGAFERAVPVVQPVPPTLTAPYCTLRVKREVARPTKRRHKLRRAREARRSEKAGAIAATVRCDQAAEVMLAGTLTEVLRKKPRHGKRHPVKFRLGPIRASVSAGVPRKLLLRLPHAALTALAQKAKESATLVLTAANANGTTTKKVTVAELKLG
jgi:hypothetical protein